jgi:hypothetical protein
MVVSQWTSALDLCSDYLNENNIRHVRFQGSMSVRERNEAIQCVHQSQQASQHLLIDPLHLQSLHEEVSYQSGTLLTQDPATPCLLIVVPSDAHESQGWFLHTQRKPRLRMNRLVASDLISRGALEWCLWTWGGPRAWINKRSIGQRNCMVSSIPAHNLIGATASVNRKRCSSSV